MKDQKGMTWDIVDVMNIEICPPFECEHVLRFPNENNFFCFLLTHSPPWNKTWWPTLVSPQLSSPMSKLTNSFISTTIENILLWNLHTINTPLYHNIKKYCSSSHISHVNGYHQNHVPITPKWYSVLTSSRKYASTPTPSSLILITKQKFASFNPHQPSRRLPLCC